MLLALAGDGNHDRRPFDLVRLTIGQPPVRVEQYLEIWPGIDMMPAAPVLGHRLLHPRSLHHAPPFPSIVVGQNIISRGGFRRSARSLHGVEPHRAAG
jgi:hypothetical protein